MGKCCIAAALYKVAVIYRMHWHSAYTKPGFTHHIKLLCLATIENVWAFIVMGMICVFHEDVNKIWNFYFSGSVVYINTASGEAVP